MKKVSVYQIWDMTTDKVLTTLTGYKDEYVYRGFLKWCNNVQIEPDDVCLIKLATVDEPLVVDELDKFEFVYFREVEKEFNEKLEIKEADLPVSE